MQWPTDRNKSRIRTIFWHHLPAIRRERLQYEIFLSYNGICDHGGTASLAWLPTNRAGLCVTAVVLYKNIDGMGEIPTVLASIGCLVAKK